VPELARRIRAFISRRVKVPRQFLPLLAAFVVTTWLADRLRTLPYILIIGPPQAGKTTLLQTLSLLCRHAFLAGDLRGTVIFYPGPASDFTLIVDNIDWDARSYGGHFRRFLIAGTAHNVMVLGSNRGDSAFGPKVLCAQTPADDGAVMSRCIQIPMVREDTAGLCKPTDPDSLKEARELQGELLQMRFENYFSISPAQLPTTEWLSSREQDMLSSLLAPFASDSWWLNSVLMAYEYVPPQQIASPHLAAVIKALFGLIHDPKFSGQVKVGHVAVYAQRYLEMDGERTKLSPRRVGDILKSLGLSSGFRGNIGYCRVMSRADRKRVHDMLSSYSIDLPRRTLSNNCEFCRKITGRVGRRSSITMMTSMRQGHG
jgi:hypothetical protein